MFLLQTLMLKEEPRDSSGVFAANYDGKEEAEEKKCYFCWKVGWYEKSREIAAVFLL